MRMVAPCTGAPEVTLAEVLTFGQPLQPLAPQVGPAEYMCESS